MRAAGCIAILAAAAALASAHKGDCQDGACDAGLDDEQALLELRGAAARALAVDESSATGDCLTGSACSGASSSVNADGTTYCCASGEEFSVAAVVVNGKTQCSCASDEEAGNGSSSATSSSSSSTAPSNAESSGNCLTGSACSGLSSA